ncbi:MBL fold metallo-hydrolase [Sphingomonas xanthus]|uniref:MBL fold metallo-hydrolase n=1 Tax=Sphingomonas xanthus TaxID=2594473 RepID=A0A516IPV3_9SPHN|nr:MBL fold metallo-hydrolase [Sphingomonas xanthus]QDP18950.1 MBL fold metallo-hydrolase [Sphingomonas xanthus]
MDAPYSLAETLEPGIARLLARNPSAFTYFGTQTYLVGEDELLVIDPGPDLPEHVDAIIAAAAGRPIIAICCTHTHRDHSPASRALKAATGAPIIGCAPLALDSIGPRADASFDRDYVPDRVLADGEVIAIDGGQLAAVATPGHTSNHLCFAYGGALFTGDHVMGWSTTVVVPPDGDMAAYMASLELLRQRQDRVYYPAHGPAVTKPAQLVRGMMGHRMQRERQILKLVGARPRDIPAIVADAYPGLDPRLIPAAGGSVHAHLLDLQRRGLVEMSEGEIWSRSRSA